MRWTAFLIATLLWAVGAFADAFTFTERRTDVVVTEVEWGYEYFLIDRLDSVSFTASFHFPGLSKAQWDSFSGVSLTGGTWEVGGSLSDASSFNSSAIVFNVSERGPLGEPIPRGKVTISRSGDNLSIVGNFENLNSSSIVGQNRRQPGMTNGKV